jgi:hypothetical protein
VAGHEIGHVVDELAGQVPVKGLDTELRQVYKTLNTGQERTRHLTGPQHIGHSGDDVPRELMTEAVRAYMADPNYLKTVAPKTAKAVRKALVQNRRHGLDSCFGALFGWRVAHTSPKCALDAVQGGLLHAL